MAEQLFPVFDFPTIEDGIESVEQDRYRPSVYFDYELGDFVRDGANRMVVADGKDAFIQWCIKTVSTEREDLLAYGFDHGTEFAYLAHIPDRLQKQNWIEETITSALMVNPACESVSDFHFTNEGDAFYVSFIVKGYDWTAEPITMQLPKLE